MAVPTVTSLDVTSGNIAGDTVVTLTGTGFTGATAVKFGTTDAASFDVVNDTTLKAISPAYAAGQVDILVTNTDGTNTAAAGDKFTFEVVSKATYVQPDGTNEGVEYFQDIDITPASLASGAIKARLDTWVYPKRGVIKAPKQGTSASANTAPAPAHDAVVI